MPMPALNIIATHEMVRNSGSSSSQPSGMLPNLPSASHSTNTTKPDAVSANSQPVLFMIQVRADPDALANVAVLTKPQTRNPSAMSAVMPNTTLSSPRLRLCNSSSIGTAKIGCDPVCPCAVRAEADAGAAGSCEVSGDSLLIVMVDSFEPCWQPASIPGAATIALLSRFEQFVEGFAQQRRQHIDVAHRVAVGVDPEIELAVVGGDAERQHLAVQ